MDDGSCVARIPGCSDASASNFNPSANVEGSCTYSIIGCTDSAALNFVSQANTDNGGCILRRVGCMSPSASNFDISANVDRGCRYDYFGCTDSYAINYLTAANVDDASCIQRVVGCTSESAENFDSTANVYVAGACRFPIPGCTDPTAVNYDATASSDDGTCRVGFRGCVYPAASNYQSEANIDDGTCEFAPIGCTDPTSLNYDSRARDPPQFDGGAQYLEPAFRYFFEAINFVRNEHCAGGLTWDAELAAGANQYAATCPTEKSSQARSGSLGETNPFSFTETQQAILNDPDRSDDEKYQALGYPLAEMYFYGLDGQGGARTYPFPANGEPSLADFDTWSDFTQMVWKSSIRIGCGVQLPYAGCPNGKLLCRFAPGGNYNGRFAQNVQQAGTCARFQGCVPRIPGCRSPQASNFDSTATVEEGATCWYDVRGCTVRVPSQSLDAPLGCVPCLLRCLQTLLV